ncbi:MAG: hypothetical protein SFV54_00175 [Bryobacteraceae bacterium]|nr:hypothetical protein [Bryobacteraceae bacterium]
MIVADTSLSSSPRASGLGCARMQRGEIVAVGAFVVTCAAAAAVRKLYGVEALRWCLPAVVLSGVLYLRTISRIVSRLDELQQRIWLEAVGFGALGIFLTGIIYPMFEKSGVLGPLQPLGMSALLVVFVIAGYLQARWRFR